MKCRDCRFWIIDPTEADPMETFSGHSPAGECHRHAPRPPREMEQLAAMVVAARNPEAVFEERSEAHACWTSRLTSWPVVHATDFCGEYVAKREVIF